MSGITTNKANDATDAKATDGANTSPLTIADVSVESYRNADVSGKAAMRRLVDSSIKSEMSRDASEIDVVSVKSLFALQAALVPVRAETVEKDYVGLIARRAAVLALASEMLTSGRIVPDGAPETDIKDVSAAFAAIMAKADDDDDDGVMSDATDIATRKVAKSGNQYNVAEIVTNAFEGVASGTFYTIRQICAKSGYAHDGAVAARLFPKSGECTIDGIVPVDRTATNVRGARKA